MPSPLFERIGQIDRHLRAQGRAFFTAWASRRTYTKAELEAADLLLLTITTVLEPAGEECGTKYDEARACEFCGAGRRQVSTLHLDPRRLPRSMRLARTIADENLMPASVSDRFANESLRGLRSLPIKGCSPSAEIIEGWVQVSVTSELEIGPSTRFGEDPFDESQSSICPIGHIAGLNLLSQVQVIGGSWDGSDLVRSRSLVGDRRGLLVPYPLLFVSQRARRLLRSMGVRGWQAEPVRFA